MSSENSLARVTNAFGVHEDSPLIRFFGCKMCPFPLIGACPHGISYADQQAGREHARKICSMRVKQLKDLYQAAYSGTKVFQVDHLVKLKIIEDYYIGVFQATGKMPREYGELSRSIIALTSAMRKQEEGTKITQVHKVEEAENFRKIIDAQAKLIKENKITLVDAEVVDDSEQEPSSSGSESEKENSSV